MNNIVNSQPQATPLSSHPRNSGRPNNTPPSHLRLDNLIVNQPAQGQYNGHMAGVAPPQPPERGSSFTVMSQTQGRSPTTPNNNTATGAKRVSFQDASPPSPVARDIQEDPNVRCFVFFIFILCVIYNVESRISVYIFKIITV